MRSIGERSISSSSSAHFQNCWSAENRTRAVDEAREKRKGDMAGILFSVTLDPTRKKSAQKGV